MTTPSRGSPSDLPQAVQGSWNRFLDVYEPLRPDLYRYCRHLTRSPWDAEDLAQDSMARAFVTLGRMGEAPPNPRAWLFRVASNLWIDQARRMREARGAVPEGALSREDRDAREAAGTLIARLSPQERAAVVLKDVFDLTLEEIAEALSTSTGAVKAALHRGRGRLVEPDPDRPRVPVPGVLDAFCDAFNARDLDRLTGLLLDAATVEVVGAAVEIVRVDAQAGAEAARSRVFSGMMYGSQKLAEGDTQSGIETRYKQGALPSSPRAEVRIHRGEPILLLWYAHADGEAVRAVNRIACDGDRIAGVRNYFYTPDCLAEICGELGVPFRINGYRHCLSGL